MLPRSAGKAATLSEFSKEVPAAKQVSQSDSQPPFLAEPNAEHPSRSVTPDFMPDRMASRIWESEGRKAFGLGEFERMGGTELGQGVHGVQLPMYS